ncbi:MAG TPA: septation protein SepH [Actinomycetales bacterium]|nr:septation protein SepH [Actinomycetales bacterium]
MQDLQLVGVHDDGEHVLLTSADGTRYRLLIDERLRAAVRRDRARLGQLQIQMDGALRPRDIQARIRAGESAEDIAVSSGLPVEHIRRYEGPVLAERLHVAQRAQRHRIRTARPGDEPQLADLVAERLEARGAEAGDWDAWRRDEATWTVQLTFRTGSKDRVASWGYDPVTESLEPRDDESRWLSALSEPAQDGPLRGRRLSAVKELVYDVEADGGVRETGGSHPPATETSRAAQQSRRTVELLDQLRERRGRRQPLAAPDEIDQFDEFDELGDLDGMDADAGHALEQEPPAAHPPASRPDEAVDAEILALPEPAAGSTSDADDAVGETGTAVAPSAEPAPEEQDEDGPAGDSSPAEDEDRGPKPKRVSRQAKTSKAKAKRPSVPSWDEIVFGAKKD